MSTLSLEVQERIAVLSLQSPPANALSSALLRDINEKLNDISADKTIKAVILQGDGRFFSAGADIKEFTGLQAATDYEALAENGQNIFRRMETFPIPIIAAIHGAALGGGLELAMACHIRIVTESAKLGLPELSLGIIPGFAGTQRLPRLVGTAKAYEMILTGEPISGKEAATIGLANQVVEEEAVFQTAKALAWKIATKSKPTIEKVMELVPYGTLHSFDEGVAAERKAFGQVFGNADAKEGVQAFIEKRQANFIDK
jgi:enoyl-CoA hydratase